MAKSEDRLCWAPWDSNSFLAFNNKKPRTLIILRRGWELFGRETKKMQMKLPRKKKEQDRDLAKKALPAADQQNLDRMRSRLTTTPHARKPSGNLTKEATLRLVTTLGNCSLGFRNNNCFRTHSAHALHSLCNSFLTYRYRSLSHLIHIK